jgi:hypothetical protein
LKLIEETYPSPSPAGPPRHADVGPQARQALLNAQAALGAAGATLHDVVRWTILGGGYDHPEHHPQYAYQHQDVTDRVNGDAMRGHGGNPEPQDGSHRDQQKACTYPHGLASLSAFWTATRSSPGMWPQTDARIAVRVPGVTCGEDCGGSAPFVLRRRVCRADT